VGVISHTTFVLATLVFNKTKLPVLYKWRLKSAKKFHTKDFRFSMRGGFGKVVSPYVEYTHPTYVGAVCLYHIVKPWKKSSQPGPRSAPRDPG